MTEKLKRRYSLGKSLKLHIVPTLNTSITDDELFHPSQAQ